MSTRSPDHDRCAIAVHDLCVTFDGNPAVDHVSFRIPDGGAFGLVGESGSGKSTVLRAIAGLIRDWQGQITVHGQAQSEARHLNFFRTVQMVFQDPYASLHPRHTADRVLAEPLALHRLDQPEMRIDQALRQVGLGPEFRFRYSHQLSGGQRQRLAIARALMLEPQILLLDEPTSALDVSVQAEILNLLSDLRTAHGLTYLLVSHDLAVVAHMCDTVAVMREGQVVETLQSASLRDNTPSSEYAQSLLDASRGYTVQ